MIHKDKFSVHMAALRRSSGYSQEALADLLRISPQAISKWGNGHSLSDTAILPDLSQALRCTIDDLIMPACTFDDPAQQN